MQNEICRVTELYPNDSEDEISMQKKIRTDHPSMLTTSGFFLYKRRRHRAAFFLTRGLQLLDIWKRKRILFRSHKIKNDIFKIFSSLTSNFWTSGANDSANSLPPIFPTCKQRWLNKDDIPYHITPVMYMERCQLATIKHCRGNKCFKK